MESVIEIKNRSIEIETAPHRQDYCKTAMLFFVLDGSITFSYESRKVTLNKMDILVINRGTEYRCDGEDDAIMASLELMGKSFESVCDGLRQHVECDSTGDRKSGYENLRRILRQMIMNQVYLRDNPRAYAHLVFDYYSLYYKLLETITGSFLSDAAQKDGSGSARDRERRDKIERYLNIHYAEAVSIEDLAEELFLSKGYLSKFFTQTFGFPFSQYLRELRLRRAMSDLLYTDKPITQIAFDNGFTGSSFFNRSFREKYKKKPSDIRREFLERPNSGHTEEKQQRELQNRINRILEEEAGPISSLNRDRKYQYSAAMSVPVKHCWNGVINIGSAADILKTDIQEHLKLLSDTMHFKYARFWDPFSREMYLSINEIRENYNFMRLDQVFDSILESGLKPFIDFEPKLERINEDIDMTIVKARQERMIESPQAWQNIVQAFVRHIIRKYGIDEVEQWIFEVPYGVYELEGTEPLEGYIALFTELQDTVRRYTQSLMVGGPMLPTADLKLTRSVLEELGRRGRQPDFVSVISFAYESSEEENKYTVRSRDEQFLYKDVSRTRDALREMGLTDTPVYITEWNETVMDRNYMNDSCYRGAYIVRNLIEIDPLTEVAGYFSGTDRRADFYDSHALLQGGNGLISRDGIIKPAGFAMQFLGRMAGYQIAAREHFMITTDRRHNYYVVAHNKKPLSYYYFKTAEKAVEKEKIRKYTDGEEYLEQEIELTEIQDGEYEMRIYKVNAHNGSVMDLWREMAYSETLSTSDIRHIRSVCKPHLLLEKVRVQNGILPLKLIMEPNEITLIEVRRMII